MSVTYYFAYGSNISEKQMRHRCPDAELICTAYLKDHKVHFLRFSKNRNCGVASIQKSPGHIVWGVIFSLTEKDLENLDRHEGVPQEDEFRPNSEYLSLIIEGLRSRPDVPAEYVESFIALS